MKRTPTEWPAPDAHDKVYWRSLDQLADTPEFRDFLHREFPEGASELSSPVSRRSFMTLMGASVGLAGLAGCRRPEERIL
ncbi:TAT-variant-translocated molybdopterin oxidoreductase, partial [Escherichia coli]|uniref:TAT-variant-translocated molybdopterin oxidoreductase n=1 Tax=Escherichia coli TaxID=562 RepID=UPI00200FB1BB